MKHQNGNALWFILLAVALIAALTATITGSSDTTEQGGNIEQLRIQASEILRFTKGVETAVTQLRMQGGAGENDISYQNDETGTTYANSNCSGDGCMIFDSSGAGIGYKIPPPGWFNRGSSGEDGYGTWEFAATNNVEGVGTSDPDIVIYIGWLRKVLCEEINYMLGVASPPLDVDDFDSTAFQGTVPSSASGSFDGLSGVKSGCIQADGHRGYTFYHVLVER